MSQHEFGLMPDANREVRIESLRRQIASGTYHVSASAVAHALIEHMNNHMHQKQMRRAA
jgi:anti-sigma28 factor (negative regulator of flagellin synthesis)